jgi:hypothetical protein
MFIRYRLPIVHWRARPQTAALFPGLSRSADPVSLTVKHGAFEPFSSSLQSPVRYPAILVSQHRMWWSVYADRTAHGIGALLESLPNIRFLQLRDLIGGDTFSRSVADTESGLSGHDNGAYDLLRLYVVGKRHTRFQHDQELDHMIPAIREWPSRMPRFSDFDPLRGFAPDRQGGVCHDVFGRKSGTPSSISCRLRSALVAAAPPLLFPGTAASIIPDWEAALRAFDGSLSPLATRNE